MQNPRGRRPGVFHFSPTNQGTAPEAALGWPREPLLDWIEQYGDGVK
jgi:hypothetical protein